MNTLSRLSRSGWVLGLAGVVLLAGCASNGATSLATKRSGFSNDADYMYVVEKVARNKGVRVVWINPPHETGKQFVRQN